MIEFPLDWPEVRVLKTELKKQEIVITVESTRPYAICSRCGQKTFEFHSYDDPIRLRHLPILEEQVIIELRPVASIAIRRLEPRVQPRYVFMSSSGLCGVIALRPINIGVRR
jgi:hypothetical protein